MSDLGLSVYEAFSFLDEFLNDVSKLLTNINDKLSNQHIIALGDAATFWDHSRAYYAPKQWMPKYIIRHYTKEKFIDKRNSWIVPWLVFFVVYLYPDRFKNPVAAWGCITQKDVKNIYKTLDKLDLYEQNPKFLKKVPTEEWTEIDDLPDSLSGFKYQSIWLTNLRDTKIVDTLVIQPLLNEAKSLRGP